MKLTDFPIGVIVAYGEVRPFFVVSHDPPMGSSRDPSGSKFSVALHAFNITTNYDFYREPTKEEVAWLKERQMTRQERWQAKQIAEGCCRICGTKREPDDAQLCQRHRQASQWSAQKRRAK